jgi:hypothetical protein
LVQANGVFNIYVSKFIDGYIIILMFKAEALANFAKIRGSERVRHSLWQAPVPLHKILERIDFQAYLSLT